jgi:hypothetical protein
MQKKGKTASKDLLVKNTKSQYYNIHKYTWTYTNGKTHTEVLIDKRRHSVYLKFDLIKELAVRLQTIWWLKNLDRLSVSKTAIHKFGMERSDVKKLNDAKLRNGIRLKSQTGLQLWKTWMIMWLLIESRNTLESIAKRAKKSLNQYKQWFDKECSKQLN